MEINQHEAWEPQRGAETEDRVLGHHLWYKLDGRAHRIDDRAMAERRDSGIVTLCGNSLYFYIVGGSLGAFRPCVSCVWLEGKPGADPDFRHEYRTTIAEEVDAFLIEHPMHDREAVTATLKRARQYDCIHEGRFVDDTDKDGAPVLLCAQCEAVLMTADDLI